MAIDSRERRASALGRGLPFITVYPIPDGSIDDSDRLQLAWLYSGIASAAPILDAFACLTLTLTPLTMLALRLTPLTVITMEHEPCP